MKVPPSLGKTYSKIFTQSQLFQFISESSSSIKGHLGDYYVPIPEDSPKKIKKLLKKLCKKGHLQVGFLLKTYESKLNDLGVIIHDQKAFWLRDEYRMNYILQK